jgi:multiple sugar transport system permease protein
MLTKNKKFTPYLFILPTMLYLFIFQLYPLIENIRLSFTNLSLISSTSPKYIGLDNYIYLLTSDSHFWKIVQNTLFWVFGSVSLQFIVGMLAALILNRKFKLRGLLRGLVLVPWVTPFVVMGIIWKWIFDGQWGLLDFILREIGLISKNIIWLGNMQTVWPSLLLVSIWKGFPYMTLVLLSGLKGIDLEIYEAAEVDGAEGWKLFRYITLPMLRPAIFVCLLVAMVTTWTKFELIWILTEGGPGVATNILPTYIYSNSFVFYNLGRGSAIATISTIIVLIISMFYIKTLKETNL